MTIVVTGAAGFIGSNLVKALNGRGEHNIIAVDDLTRGDKFKNLVNCEIADYFDKETFLSELMAGAFDGQLEAVFHQGACSDTMESDGRYMMQNNYRYSLALLDHCQGDEVPFIYASSAAVYGAGNVFREAREHEAPINVYGYSKFLFDQKVRRRLHERTSQIVGLRYFNVYGTGEAHKGRMASVARQFFEQYRTNRKVRLFEGSGGFDAGEQKRDFISIEDVCKVNLFFLDNAGKSGIFNVGTGTAASFNEVAAAVINACDGNDEGAGSLVQNGKIEYIPLPAGLKEKYQSYTKADIQCLREAGYETAFVDVKQGVHEYVKRLNVS
ncbi:MAG: ADP-glyceromanno-heptose 6-epimerase [Burkholderiales bacterium]